MKLDRKTFDGDDWVLTFVIPGHPVSMKNGKQIRRKRSGVPFIASGDNAAAWLKNATDILRVQWLGQPPLPKRFMNAAIESVGSKADADNLYCAPLDALEKAGILPNDYWVRSHDGSDRRMCIGDEPEHVRVTLTPWAGIGGQ